jgi:hypothetical protein
MYMKSRRINFPYRSVLLAAVLLSSLFILPTNAEAQLATVAAEPYIFVPNGAGAELLIDNQNNTYWLHIVSGDVYFRRYNSSHLLEIPDKLVYDNGTNERVDAAWDDSGNMHFTWATDHFGNMSVMYAKIDTNGDFIASPLKLSADNDDWDYASAIAVNSLGQAFVVWDNWWDLASWLDEDVLYAMVNANGSINFTQQYVAPSGWDTTFYGKKDLIVDRSDNLHIIFDRQYPNGDIRVYYKKFSSDGTTILVSDKLLNPVTYKDFASSTEAVLDSQDRINIAQSYGVDGGMMEVFYLRIDLDGNVDIGPTDVSPQDQNHSHQAYLAMDELDNSYVFWRETKDGNGEIYYSVVNETGDIVINQTRLTNTSAQEGVYYMGAVFEGDFCTRSYYDDNGTYVVYQAPPPVTTLTPGPPNYGTLPTFVTSSTSISLSVTDPSGYGVLGTYYQIDTLGWMNYSLGGPFTVSGEGAHAIHYNSTGTVGNVEVTKTYDVVVDDTAPTSSLEIGNPSYTSGVVWVSSDTSLSIDAADGGTTPVGVNRTLYRTWAGGWTALQEYSAPFNLDVEGMNYVEFYSVDLLGNQEVVRNETLHVDDTPPTSTLQPDRTEVDPDETFTLEAIDDGCGVSEIQYSLDGGVWQTYTEEFSVDEIGEHTISYLSVDNLDNAEHPRDFEFKVVGLDENWKPVVALVFAVILLLCGLFVCKKRSAEAEDNRFWKMFMLISLPFILAEAVTGIASLVTGSLSIPPAAGVGTILDVGILIVGLVALLVRRKPEMVESEEGVSSGDEIKDAFESLRKMKDH